MHDESQIECSKVHRKPLAESEKSEKATSSNLGLQGHRLVMGSAEEWRFPQME